MSAPSAGAALLGPQPRASTYSSEADRLHREKIFAAIRHRRQLLSLVQQAAEAAQSRIESKQALVAAESTSPRAATAKREPFDDDWPTEEAKTRPKTRPIDFADYAPRASSASTGPLVAVPCRGGTPRFFKECGTKRAEEVLKRTDFDGYQALVGTAVAVDRHGDGQYQEGVIAMFGKSGYTIRYKNGEEECLDLAAMLFRFSRPKPTIKLKLKRSIGTLAAQADFVPRDEAMQVLMQLLESNNAQLAELMNEAAQLHQSEALPSSQPDAKPKACHKRKAKSKEADSLDENRALELDAAVVGATLEALCPVDGPSPIVAQQSVDRRVMKSAPQKRRSSRRSSVGATHPLYGCTTPATNEACLVEPAEAHRKNPSWFFDALGPSADVSLSAVELTQSPVAQLHQLDRDTLACLDLLNNPTIQSAEFDDRANDLRFRLRDSLNSVGNGKWKGHANVGDGISADTYLLMVAHWNVPRNLDKGHLDPRGLESLMYRLNETLRALDLLIPRSLHKGAGGVWTEEIHQLVSKAISMLDIIPIIPLTKDTHKKDFRTFAKEAKITLPRLHLIGFGLHGLHVRSHVLRHGTAPPVVVATADGFRVGFSTNAPVLWCAHGQCISMRIPLMNPVVHTDEHLALYSRNLRFAFLAIARRLGSKFMPNPPPVSFVAERYGARLGHNLDADEVMARVLACMDASKEGGETVRNAFNALYNNEEMTEKQWHIVVQCIEGGEIVAEAFRARDANETLTPEQEYIVERCEEGAKEGGEMVANAFRARDAGEEIDSDQEYIVARCEEGAKEGGETVKDAFRARDAGEDFDSDQEYIVERCEEGGETGRETQAQARARIAANEGSADDHDLMERTEAGITKMHNAHKRIAAGKGNRNDHDLKERQQAGVRQLKKARVAARSNEPISAELQEVIRRMKFANYTSETKALYTQLSEVIVDSTGDLDSLKRSIASGLPVTRQLFASSHLPANQGHTRMRPVMSE